MKKPRGIRLPQNLLDAFNRLPISKSAAVSKAVVNAYNQPELLIQALRYRVNAYELGPDNDTDQASGEGRGAEARSRTLAPISKLAQHLDSTYAMVTVSGSRDEVPVKVVYDDEVEDSVVVGGRLVTGPAPEVRAAESGDDVDGEVLVKTSVTMDAEVEKMAAKLSAMTKLPIEQVFRLAMEAYLHKL